MKLFLTSAGLSNPSITAAMAELLGKPLAGVKLAFVPTAANVETGDKSWMIDDLNNCRNAGLEVDIVDISAVPQPTWQSRLEEAEIILFGGGNTFHLMYWIKESGLQDLIPELFAHRIYAGISAGSCVAGPTIYNSVQNLFGEKSQMKVKEGLGLVDFQFMPHLNSPFFPKLRRENLELAAKDISEPVYALDDNSVIVINGDHRRVVSEGEWHVFNDTASQ